MAGLLNSGIGTQQVRLNTIIQKPSSLLSDATRPSSLEIAPARKTNERQQKSTSLDLVFPRVNSSDQSTTETKSFTNIESLENVSQLQASMLQSVLSLATTSIAPNIPQDHAEKPYRVFNPEKVIMLGNRVHQINPNNSLQVARDTVQDDSIQQYIPLNSDNDNGSAWVKTTQQQEGQTVEITQKHIPEKYDFQKTGYGVDDDLDSLILQWKNIPPEFALTGIYNYKIVLLPNDPGGDLSGIKIWKDKSKTLQLPVNSTGYVTDGMTGIPAAGKGQLPGFYLEGMKPGKMVDEFSITVFANTKSNVPNPLVSKEVKVTVTPVIKSFAITNMLDPAVIEKPPAGSNNLWLVGTIEWKAEVYVYDYFSGSQGSSMFGVDFTQHLKSDTDLLPGGFAAYKNGDPTTGYKHRYKSAQNGPNKIYPFLDSAVNVDPYYGHNTLQSAEPRLVIITGSDQAGLRVADNPNTSFYNQIGFESLYRTELVWASHEIWDGGNDLDVIYPLAYFDWKVRFDIVETGYGPNNKTQPEGSVVYSNAPQFPYIPSYPEDGVGLKPFPRQ